MNDTSKAPFGGDISTSGGIGTVAVTRRTSRLLGEIAKAENVSQGAMAEIALRVFMDLPCDARRALMIMETRGDDHMKKAIAGAIGERILKIYENSLPAAEAG